MTSAHVTSLTTDDNGHVTGVRYRQGLDGEDIDLPAAAVVLTTGGTSSLPLLLLQGYTNSKL